MYFIDCIFGCGNKIDDKTIESPYRAYTNYEPYLLKCLLKVVNNVNLVDLQFCSEVTDETCKAYTHRIHDTKVTADGYGTN